MNIELSEADKKKAFEWIGHFWYLIIILILLIGTLVVWQKWGSAKAELNTLRSQLTMQEDIQKTEERSCFHRVLKERQFRVRAPFEDVRDVLPAVLLVDLQGTGGLLPPEDEGVQFHLSHTDHRTTIAITAILRSCGSGVKVRQE